jgi:hypothetical protein
MVLIPNIPVFIDAEVERTIYIAPFASLPILGSQDKRVGLTLGFQVAKREKRFSYDNHPVDLVWDINLSHNYGGGWNLRPRDKTWNASVLVLGRRSFPTQNESKWFVELGWGLNLASNPTFDLDATLNSSPILGVGYEFPYQGKRAVVALRLNHISNAGFVGANQGQNQLQLMMGIRF